MDRSHLRGSLLVLLAGVVFSFGALFFRWTDDISAWEYLTTRSLGAVVVTGAVFSLQHRGRVRAEVASVERVHVVAGVVLGSTFCLFIVSLSEADAAFVLFFQALAPIGAAFCSWFLLRERVSNPAVVATVVSLVGVGVMVNGGLGSSPGWVVPVVVALPLAIGLYTTLIRMGDAVDPLVPVIVAGATALVLSTLVVVIDGGWVASARDLGIGLAAGVVLLALPLPLFNRGGRDVPAPETSLLLMSEVVLAPLWVWLFVDETPADATLVGGVVILAAVVWLTVHSAGGFRLVRTSRG